MKVLKIAGFGAFMMFTFSLYTNAQVRPDTTHKKPGTTVPRKTTPTAPSKTINTDTVYQKKQPGQPIPPIEAPKPPAIKPDTSGEHPKR